MLDDGTVLGVPEKAAPDMIKNFISCISNPALFTPTVYLSPEIIQYESKTIIHIHVLPGAEVYSYKKVIYNRVDDADVKVTATAQIAQMYIRKQEIFTERKVYPYVEKTDLRLDMLPKLRVMAQNQSNVQGHPWNSMTDDELLKSARLYTIDRVTGKHGFNLAAVMLLGKDDVIMDIAPAYVTDALLRRINVDRYDDREIVQTNLVESYELLMEFARKHLPDKFFMEDDQRKSLRNIIAAFFRNIGYADQLGSGVRNLFKYSKYYSGKDPEFIEGDIFRIIVPLDAGYSFDFGQAKPGHEAGSPGYADIEGKFDESTGKVREKYGKSTGKVYEKLNASQKKIIGYVEKNGMITNKEAQKLLNIKESRALKVLRELTNLELLKKEGKSKGTYYVLKNKGE